MASGRFVLNGHSLIEVHPGIWRIEPSGKMHAGVNLVGTREILERIKDDKSVEQALNVATLPGVLDPVLTMPDIHQGYGFPIGGVAAFRLKNGIVSPGGVGYDINCGVRMLRTTLTRDQIFERNMMRDLVSRLYDAVPAGVGSRRSDLDFSESELDEVLSEGAQWAVKRGFGTAEDIQFTEENGRMPGADPNAVSHRAKQRGMNQLGTLGSGNHFLEIQYVDEIRNKKAAEAFGLFENQVVITIHTGSRGLGYQVCEEYLDLSINAAKKYGIELVDRELAAAPLDSEEGKQYLCAMSAAANFAFANRQVITHWVRAVFAEQFGNAALPLLYDVCHNIAKIEEMPIGGVPLSVCIHRKGATRAYPPQHPKVPAPYRNAGQPVLVPGDMGRYSFVLAGCRGSLELTFGSACHGAGENSHVPRRRRSAKAGR